MTVSLITVPAAVPPLTVYNTVNVPEAPAATLTAVQGLAGNPAQLHPAGGVIEKKVVFAGVVSLKVPFAIAEEPVFVTTCVYVIGLPAWTGFGDATLVTKRFGPEVPTIVVAVAVLFARFGSTTDEPTLAVPVITVPFGVPLATFTTNVKLAEIKPAMFALVHTRALEPARQLHPAGAVKEENVVLLGYGNTNVALSAALGPLLVTTTVYVMFPLAATGFGEAAAVTARSALEPTAAVSVAVSLRRLASPPPETVAIFVIVAGAACETSAVNAIEG